MGIIINSKFVKNIHTFSLTPQLVERIIKLTSSPSLNWPMVRKKYWLLCQCVYFQTLPIWSFLLFALKIIMDTDFVHLGKWTYSLLYHVLMEKGIYLCEGRSILPGERGALTEKMELVFCDSSCSAIRVAKSMSSDPWSTYIHNSSWLPTRVMLLVPKGTNFNIVWNNYNQKYIHDFYGLQYTWIGSPKFFQTSPLVRIKLGYIDNK